MITYAISTCYLVNAIQFFASRSGFGAMLSAVYGFKIKSGLFDDVDSVIEDWIVDQMHIFSCTQVTAFPVHLLLHLLFKSCVPQSGYYLCKIKGGGTIDLELCLTHSLTMEPTLAFMEVERTMTTRAAASVSLGA